MSSVFGLLLIASILFFISWEFVGLIKDIKSKKKAKQEKCVQVDSSVSDENIYKGDNL